MVLAQRYVEYLAIQESYDIREREFLPPFSAMCGLAFSLHVVFFLILSLIPTPEPKILPLHMLSLRLGGGQALASALDQEEEKKQAAREREEREKSVPAASRPVPTPQKRYVSRPAAKDAAPRVQRSAPTVTPRASTWEPNAAPPGPGVPYGNALTGAQTVERYTRVLSLRVQSQASQVRLTEEFRAYSAGRRVVVELLLVIGQDGRLLRSTVTRGSGCPELDQAAVRAAQAAMPYPPPPPAYSGFGFKVAVFVD
jgi:protein TonB